MRKDRLFEHPTWLTIENLESVFFHNPDSARHGPGQRIVPVMRCVNEGANGGCDDNDIKDSMHSLLNEPVNQQIVESVNHRINNQQCFTLFLVPNKFLALLI